MSDPVSVLERWLVANERSWAWLARQLDVSKAAVHAWATRVSRPTQPYREAIEVLTHAEVTAALWETEEERTNRMSLLDRVRGGVS